MYLYHGGPRHKLLCESEALPSVMGCLGQCFQRLCNNNKWYNFNGRMIFEGDVSERNDCPDKSQDHDDDEKATKGHSITRWKALLSWTLDAASFKAAVLSAWAMRSP